MSRRTHVCTRGACRVLSYLICSRPFRQIPRPLKYSTNEKVSRLNSHHEEYEKGYTPYIHPQRILSVQASTSDAPAISGAASRVVRFIYTTYYFSIMQFHLRCRTSHGQVERLLLQRRTACPLSWCKGDSPEFCQGISRGCVPPPICACLPCGRTCRSECDTSAYELRVSRTRRAFGA